MLAFLTEFTRDTMSSSSFILIAAVVEYDWLFGEFITVFVAFSLKTAKYQIEDDFPAKTGIVVLNGSTG